MLIKGLKTLSSKAVSLVSPGDLSSIGPSNSNVFEMSLGGSLVIPT